MALPLFAAVISKGGGLASGLNVSGFTHAWPGTAVVRFKTDGGVGYRDASSESSTDYWFIGEPVTSIGDNVSVRLVKTAGDSLSGSWSAENTWYALTSLRDFGISVIASRDYVWTGYCEYSFDGGSTVARTSASFSITAQYIGP